jgi:probable phosphoglycerate mutase
MPSETHEAAESASSRTASRFTVFVVRHGRTELNAEGRLRGRVDVPLDDVGKEEAAALGRAFAFTELRTILASPLARATETAAAIGRATGTPVTLDEDLIDRDYGPWNGAPVEDVRARFGSIDEAPGVEPLADFVRRVTRAVERAANAAPATVVAHDAVNRHALATLVPALGGADAITQRTGCWNELERSPSGWRARVIDAPPDRPVEATAEH